MVIEPTCKHCISYHWVVDTEFMENVLGLDIIKRLKEMNQDPNKLVTATQIFPRIKELYGVIEHKEGITNINEVMYYDCFIYFKSRFAGVVMPEVKK